MILLLISMPVFTEAQTQKIRFKILRNDSCIGEISIEKNTINVQTSYHLKSELLIKMLIDLHIISTEETIFKNGKLKYSTVNRKINNNEKTNKKVEYINGKYQLYNGKKSRTTKLDSVSINLASLYLSEPCKSQKVFVDNHQSISPIIPLGNNSYKVILPDGNYNIFYYKNGKCINVEVFNNLYHVQILPKD
ncbi:MAG: DUF6134 family protein [Daejeonella sp.]